LFPAVSYRYVQFGIIGNPDQRFSCVRLFRQIDELAAQDFGQHPDRQEKARLATYSP
jgi:hypothetical protein